MQNPFVDGHETWDTYDKLLYFIIQSQLYSKGTQSVCWSLKPQELSKGIKFLIFKKKRIISVSKWLDKGPIL